MRVHLAMVTDDRSAVIDELSPAFGLTAEEAAQTPHALIGSVEEICDQLLERRERWGISYLGMSRDQLEPFAPVVPRDCPARSGSRHSHSIVPGGFDVRSRTTRLTSRTSLVMRLEIRSRTS